MNGTKRFSPPFHVDSAAAPRRCVAASRRGSATHTPGRVVSGVFESSRWHSWSLIVSSASRDAPRCSRRGREWCGHNVVGREGGRDRTECSRVGHVGASVSKVRPVAAVSLRRSAPLRVVVFGFLKPSRWSNSVRRNSAGIPPEPAISKREIGDRVAGVRATHCRSPLPF